MSSISALSAPAGICLIRFDRRPADNCPEACYRTGPVDVRRPDGTVGLSYEGATLGDTPEIWYFRGAPYGGERMTLYHEYCHAHQQQVAIRAGVGRSIQSFFLTEEGLDFLRALQEYKADLARRGQSYFGPGGGKETEDHAQFCAGWYYGDFPPTATVPFIADHAARYWPR